MFYLSLQPIYSKTEIYFSLLDFFIGLIIFLFLLKHINDSLMRLRWTMSKLLQIAEKLFLFKKEN